MKCRGAIIYYVDGKPASYSGGQEFEIVCNAAEEHDIYFRGGGGAGFNEPSTSMQMSST